MFDIAGMRFGRLVVKHRSGTSKSGNILWYCRCDCGNTAYVISYNLRKGFTRSCGCLLNEFIGNLNKSHGMSNTSTYRIWLGMRRRCYSEKANTYERYGGRGITICKRWNKFENFHADMGERPKGMTLDRWDNNKSYCKSNCRWASYQIQANNKRNNHLITFKGKVQTMAQWSREIGLSQSALKMRLKRGWSVERALTEPLNEM